MIPRPTRPALLLVWALAWATGCSTGNQGTRCPAFVEGLDVESAANAPDQRLQRRWVALATHLAHQTVPAFEDSHLLEIWQKRQRADAPPTIAVLPTEIQLKLPPPDGDEVSRAVARVLRRAITRRTDLPIVEESRTEEMRQFIARTRQERRRAGYIPADSSPTISAARRFDVDFVVHSRFHDATLDAQKACRTQYFVFVQVVSATNERVAFQTQAALSAQSAER